MAATRQVFRAGRCRSRRAAQCWRPRRPPPVGGIHSAYRDTWRGGGKPPPTVSGSRCRPRPQETDALAPSPTPGGLDARPGGAEGGMTAREKVEAAAELAEAAPPPVWKRATRRTQRPTAWRSIRRLERTSILRIQCRKKPLPVEPQDVEFSDVTHTCTLSVRCDTISGQHGLAGSGRWSWYRKTESYSLRRLLRSTRESVFNVLQREMRKAGIHMEFEDTPMYNSAYIEGINNLYEV